jgi:DNA-binding NarL/FixJ family response regulator
VIFVRTAQGFAPGGFFRYDIMQPHARAASTDGSLRVLIADDHPLFAEALTLTLEADSRVEVAGHAQNGQEAVALVSELRPDVVLMDLDMPVLDGFEATRGVREVSPSTRVVVVTASAAPGDSAKAFAAGASAYLRKGCITTELLDAIFAVAPATEQTVLRSGRTGPRRGRLLRRLAAKTIRARLAFQ